MLHQYGEVGEEYRDVRRAAHWDQLEEEATVGLDVAMVRASLEPGKRLVDSRYQTRSPI